MAKITDMILIPGTLNVTASSTPNKIDATYIKETHPELLKKNRKGIWLWRVLIAGLYEGFAFQADEENYPNDLLEIVSDHHLRTELNLQDGDEIKFLIF